MPKHNMYELKITIVAIDEIFKGLELINQKNKVIFKNSMSEKDYFSNKVIENIKKQISEQDNK